MAKKVSKKKTTFAGKGGSGLSTGSTLLNLACTGKPDVGFLPGKYYLFVGDSASGKTFLTMTCFAEATINKAFTGYRLVYDNIEDGCLMDLAGLFNEEVERRVEAPAHEKETGEPIYSSTVEEFYYHVDDHVKRAKKTGQPFIYVLDSMDALFSESADKKFEEQKQAHRKGKASAGSYGDGKAKFNSENLRKALTGVRDTNSILIVLCQTRDSIGSMFGGKTRAGGKSLRFYATLEIWFSIRQRLKKNIKGKPREIGIRSKIDIKKNRITGKCPAVEVDIFPSMGLDDIGTCVDFLVEEGWWHKPDGASKIKATTFKIEATRDKIIRMIERKGLEKELAAECGKCWHEIEEASKVIRKNRYSK